MKICFIHSLYPPFTRGGAEVVVKNTINALIEKNHEVALITLGRKNEVSHEGKLIIFRIKSLNIFSFIDIQKKPLFLRVLWHPMDMFNVLSRKKVKKILLEEKPELVITHNLKGIGYLIPRLLKKLRIKNIHYLHDVQLTRPSGIIFYGHEKPFLILDKMYEKICRRLFGSPDTIISPSAYLMKYYKVRGFFYTSQWKVLPNPIVQLKIQKDDAYRAKNYGEKLNFVFIGQLEAGKGIFFLIKMLQSSEEKNWELKIVGSGKAEREIRSMISGDERFKLYGYIKNSNIPQILSQSDACFVPSLCYENSPTVIYESLSNGVPVIASDIGGISELVKENINGFTFEPGNKENFLKVFYHITRHPEVLEKLRKNTLTSVKNYSIDTYIDELLSLV